MLFVLFPANSLLLARRGISALADKGTAGRELAHFPYGDPDSLFVRTFWAFLRISLPRPFSLHSRAVRHYMVLHQRICEGLVRDVPRKHPCGSKALHGLCVCCSTKTRSPRGYQTTDTVRTGSTTGHWQNCQTSTRALASYIYIYIYNV